MLKIIKASAGSGKTYTLALEYIALLIGEPCGTDGKSFRLCKDKNFGFPREYHRHILAVTFTNKATDEMKQRIVYELAVLADILPNKKSGKIGDSPYMKDLCARFSAGADEVREATKKALVELLFDYANFNVSTLDTFFQMILRTFAAEVELPYDYEIELDDSYALAVGIHEFLTSMNADRHSYAQALGWLGKYVVMRLSDGKEWNPFKASGSDDTGDNSLFSLAHVINKEFFRKRHKEMEDYLSGSSNGSAKGSNIGLFQNAVNKIIAEHRRRVEDAAKIALTAVDSSGFQDQVKSNGNVVPQLMKITADFQPDSKFVETLIKNHGNDIFKSAFLKKNVGVAQPVQEVVDDACQVVIDSLKGMKLYQLISGNIFQLGLLGYISSSVFKFRQENSLILLSDTNELLTDIINDDDTPFIYERIGTRVNHFLVDEFQDTSAMQWQNMEPLLRESLSGGHEDLIIGDEKQCIYRFRNSDPSLLQSKVQSTFRDQITPTSSKSRNWRSSPNVIKFNNTLFTKFAELSKLTDTYSNVIQLYNAKNDEINGYVRINVLSKEQYAQVDKRIPDLICDMLDRGYQLRDIAILVNKRKEGTDTINEILKYNERSDCRHRLDVVSSESLMLNNSPSVRLIVSHLRYLAISTSPKYEAGAPVKTKKDLVERLHRMLRQYEECMNSNMTAEEAIEECFRNPANKEKSLSDIRELLPSDTMSYSIVTIVERIIEKTISKKALHDENPYIQAFQDLVIDFCSRNAATLLSFLRWWDRTGSSFSIASPAGKNAVNVMTIHKSKGLEFKCVIIPKATWEIGKLDNTLWFSKEDVVKSCIFKDVDKDIIPPLTPVSANSAIYDTALKDSYCKFLQESVSDCMNKTYVAFTRAVDELHIFTTDVRNTADQNLEATPQALPYYFSKFFASQSQDMVNEMNAEYAKRMNEPGADIATTLTRGTCNIEVENEDGSMSDEEETFYELGELPDCAVDAEERENKEPQIEEMPPYYVINRHNLAQFKLPDVFRTTQQEEGDMLHKVLSYIRTPKDVDRALFYCKTRFIIPPEKYDEACATIRSIIDQSDEVRSWFAPGNKVYNERSIIDGPLRKRPDRIIETPDGTTMVIDYKFGTLHSPKYKEQVQEYMQLLSKSGFTNIVGRIWYPHEGVIEEVSL